MSAISTTRVVIIAGAILAGVGGMIVTAPSGPHSGPTGTATPTGTPSGVANAWVDQDGGSCAHNTVPFSYTDATACPTLDAAWDTLLDGETARVAAGTSYGAQTITGTRTAPTYIIGASKPSVTIGALTTTAPNLVLRDVTVNVGNTIAVGWVGGNNVTLENVDVLGGQATVNLGGVNGAVWRGGEFGGPNPFARDCPGQHEPFELFGSLNTTISGVTLWPQAVREASPNCVDGHYHLETFRIDQGAANIRIESNRFKVGDASNSATIFITESPPGSGQPHDITIQNNIFEGGTNASNIIATQSPAISTCSNYIVAYNTFLGGESVNFSGCTTWPGTQIIGNLGPHQNLSCWGATSWVKNTWQHQFSSTMCGSDVRVAGTSFASENLGIDSTGHLLPGSPGINAGETPGPTDYCTATLGLTGLGSIDFDNEVRPFAGAGICDAGADEKQ